MTTDTDPTATADAAAPGTADTPLPATEPDFTPPAEDPAWRDLQRYTSESDLLKVLAGTYPGGAEVYRGWAGTGSLRRQAYFAGRAEQSLPEDVRAALADAGFGFDHPAVLKAMAHLGRAVATAAHSMPTASLADQLDKEIREIMNQHYGRPTYAEAHVQNRLRVLFARRNGLDPNAHG